MCWRAFYTGMQGLSHDEMQTGVLFGMLKDIDFLQRTHATNNLVFCFDDGPGIRKTIFPGYKASREQQRSKMSSDERLRVEALIRQVDLLKTNLLADIGYRNIVFQSGYEGDDMIAAICQHHCKKDLIVVSSDQDMYQLLSDRVRIWSPRKNEMYTKSDFKREWGLEPREWALVKAIAGCKSDDIPGIPGVGEKTAAKFLLGTMNQNTTTWKNIMNGRKAVRKYYKLVKLPLPGVEPIRLTPTEIEAVRWNKVVKKLGMTSLVRATPRFAGGR